MLMTLTSAKKTQIFKCILLFRLSVLLDMIISMFMHPADGLITLPDDITNIVLKQLSDSKMSPFQAQPESTATSYLDVFI